MKPVMLGVIEYTIPYEDYTYVEKEVITEGIVENPNQIKKEDVLNALENIGVKNPKIEFEYGYTFSAEGFFRSGERNFKVNIVPALQIGERFYKLEEIAPD